MRFTSSLLGRQLARSYAGNMQKSQTRRRMVELAQSTERRLRKLPKLIRKELRSGFDRQVALLRQIESSIELVAHELNRQREDTEGNSDV
jgi:hypothetical protein